MQSKLIKKSGYVGALALTLCGGVLASTIYSTSSVSADVQEQKTSQNISKQTKQETTVSSFNELSEALKDASVNVIKLGGNITFDRAILNIPQRPITIDGQGHNLTLGYNYITGAIGSEVGILTVKNTNITNMSPTGTAVSNFFTSASENWSVNIAGGVNYSGERFLLVQNSIVTFSGKNKIDTGAENAWVRSIVFAPDSEYTSTAASAGQYSGFYFNGNLVNGKAAGKVTVDKNAKVNITVSPDSDKNFYYPAFYDKVNRIDVNEGAKLNISAAGHVLQFIPRTDYEEVPSVNVANNAHLNLVSKGGGKYSALSFQQKDTQVNVNEGGNIYVEGNSPTLIDTTLDNSINVTNANYDFRNTLSGGKLFKSTLNSRLSLNQVTLNTWGTTGGEYQEDPTNSWDKLSLGTIINGNTSSSTVSTNPEAQKNFQISNYGRISGGFEKENHIEAPILNVVNDKDTQLTGFGTSGATVNIYSDGQLLGSTVVDADGRWILSLEAPLKEGTKVEASQVINGEESEKVSQIVSHLSSDTVNFFKYGYLQSYGLILEGSIDNGDLDLSNKDAVKKTINLVNENGDIVQSSEVANTDWYNPGVFNGYQAMLTNEMLATVKEGSYKLTVTLTVGDFTETQDLNVSNARYVGHTIFDQIEALNTGTNTVKTVNKGGIGYLTITNN